MDEVHEAVVASTGPLELTLTAGDCRKEGGCGGGCGGEERCRMVSGGDEEAGMLIVSNYSW